MFNSQINTFKTFFYVSLTILFFGDVMVFSAAQVVGLNTGGSSFAISWKQIFVSIASLPFAWVIAQIPLDNLKKIAAISICAAIISKACRPMIAKSSSLWLRHHLIIIRPSISAPTSLTSRSPRLALPSKRRRMASSAVARRRSLKARLAMSARTRTC